VCGAADTTCQVNKQCNAGLCAPVNKTNGTACGSATNAPPCNAPDSCLDGACQANLAANGASCGDSTGTRECDGADSCQNGTCNPNFYGSIVCGSAPTDCQLPNRCSSGSCQVDPQQYDPVGTPCGNPGSSACDLVDSCNGTGFCNPNHVGAGTPCGDPGSGACDAPDACSGTGSCDPKHAVVGSSCGDASNTTCNAADSCNAAGQCATNLAPLGTPCGPAATACKPQDQCDGAGACPDKGVVTPCSGTITGVIKSAETGLPVAGVSVWIHEVTVTPAVTNAAGQFTLPAPF
jgi:hypothetical protein